MGHHHHFIHEASHYEIPDYQRHSWDHAFMLVSAAIYILYGSHTLMMFRLIFQLISDLLVQSFFAELFPA